ncbi:type III effector protein [Acidovorax sp. NCPPB 2350]|nr:type III effector protein [Acidovorax sp. NCPPB 2350]
MRVCLATMLSRLNPSISARASAPENALQGSKKTPGARPGKQLRNASLAGLAGHSRPETPAQSAAPRAKLQKVARQIGQDAITYRQVQKRLNDHLRNLHPDAGFKNEVHFSDASLAELESILRHISVSPHLLEESRGKSATTPLFTKTLLMPLLDGGQLRLHEFSAGGGAQQGEEDPHMHRWNLKTEHIKGAYVQQIHEETQAGAPGAQPHQKYRLEATPRYKTERQFTHLGEVPMRQSARKLYSEGQAPHDFPLPEIHSVADLGTHVGTTITLARTGKAMHADSISYNVSPEIRTTNPLGRAPGEQQFIEAIQRSIAMLQLVQLRRDLEAHLQGKEPSSLTEGERRHLEDAKAPNYFETSLLPALATLDLALEAGEPSQEFSESTIAHLRSSLERIQETPLHRIVAENDAHIGAGLFSTELNDLDQLKALIAAP